MRRIRRIPVELPLRWWRRVRAVSLAALLLAAAAGPQGCIAATVATIAVVASRSGGRAGQTAQVELDVAPEQVWAAQLRVLERRPDIEIEEVDAVRRSVTFSKDRNQATATIGAYPGGDTLLKVEARSSDRAVSEIELAERIVAAVLEELDVEYRVRETAPPIA